MKVFGLTEGDIFVKSKFNPGGTVRTFEDLEWALKTFEFENPGVGIIGSFLKAYFKKHKSVRYFEERQLITLMLKILKKSSKIKSKQSLLDLKISITSGNNNSIEMDQKIESLGNELGQSMDVTLEEEPRDSPERR